jgi:hypothetical protein
MDASNLATLFTPNVLHNFAEETAAATSGVTFASSNTEKLEYVAVMKTLVNAFVAAALFYPTNCSGTLTG